MARLEYSGILRIRFLVMPMNWLMLMNMAKFLAQSLDIMSFGQRYRIKNWIYNLKNTNISPGAGLCSIDVRVGTEKPQFDFRYGYQIYPNKENYKLTNINESNGLTTTSATPEIEFIGLEKYTNVDKVIIYLDNEITETKRGRGRPRKNPEAIVAAAATTAIIANNVEKKKRGRPRKEETEAIVKEVEKTIKPANQQKKNTKKDELLTVEDEKENLKNNKIIKSKTQYRMGSPKN